ncbi:MAG TPA: YIP1 family protein [Gemmatimonadaceae bacterium]|nr:YIP1 family protein [Gemmatimonadaceae bacterium]
MTEIADAPVTAAPEKASLFEDFIDIFFAPSKVYARRANSGFWLVTLIVTVLLGVLFIANSGVMEGIMSAEFNRGMAEAMEQNPNLTAEQMQAGRGVMETAGKIGVFIMIPIMVLVLGLIVWAVGKMFGAALGYTASAMIVAYAIIPRVLESVLTALQGLVLDTATLTSRFDLSLGVGRFLDADTMNAGLLAFLGRIDVFTIWITILIAIGISVVGKIPRSKAYVAGAVIWLIGGLPALIQMMMA